MPTIAFISPKGGCGKTTASILLAQQLARKTDVIIIDADPNHPVADWAKLPGKPDNLLVLDHAGQENIIDMIDEAAVRAPFVIVDCEGTASLTVSYAVGSSDLVVIPTQGSQLDARQAAKALSLIKNTMKQSRRKIAHTVLLTRTNPVIKPRTLAHIYAQLQDFGVPIMKTQINEREAFRALFSFGGVLEDLDPKHVPNIAKAVQNARAFTTEIISMLKQSSSDCVNAE